MFKGFNVGNWWYAKLGIEVLRESKIGENRVGGRGSDNEETTALESRLSDKTPTATVLLPLVVYDRKGPKAPVKHHWRTWVRSVSNLKKYGC